MTARHPEDTFRPLRTLDESRRAWVVVIAPLLWLVAAVLTALVAHRADLIGLAVGIAFGFFVVGLAGFWCIWRARLRRERSYADDS